MRIRTIAKLSQPWDESSTSTNATVNTNDGNNSTNSNTSTPSIHILPQPLPHNPYQPATQPSLPTHIMNNLRSWILTPRAPPPPQNVPPHTNTTNLPTEINIPQINSLPEILNLQTLLTSQTENVHWGDEMTTPKPFNTFRVLARNVNTMSNTNNYLSWRAAAHAIDTSEADAIAFQETNLAWNKIHRKCIHSIFKSPTSNAVISTSSSS